MNVLIWDPFFRTGMGGGEVVVSNLIEGLPQAGIDCAVASMRKGDETTGNRIVNVRIDLRLQKIMYSSYAFEIFSPILERSIAKIFETNAFDFVQIEHPVLSRVLVRALERVPTHRRPLTVFDLGSLELDLSPFRSHMGPIQFAIVQDFHRGMYSSLKRIDFLNAVSLYNVRLLRKRGISPKVGLMTINMNMVRDEWLEMPPDRAKRYFETPLKIYIPGRIERVKGHGIILAALKRVMEKQGRGTFQVKFTGRGHFREPFLKGIDAANMSSSFNDAGWIDYHSLKNLYQNVALVLVMYQHAGVFSQVIAEGMSTGNCVVASRLGAFREAVNDEKNGILVPHDDPEELARTIGRLMNNRDTLQKLGMAANEKAKSVFSRSELIKRLASFYEAPKDHLLQS